MKKHILPIFRICLRINVQDCSLQPVIGEYFVGITGHEARTDVKARGEWRNGQNTYFDMIVTNI